MKMPYKSDPNIWSILIAFGMTLMGGIASYSFKVLSGEMFSWRTFCLQIIVSIFAGLIMIMIAIHYGGRRNNRRVCAWLVGQAHPSQGT